MPIFIRNFFIYKANIQNYNIWFWTLKKSLKIKIKLYDQNSMVITSSFCKHKFDLFDFHINRFIIGGSIVIF